MMPKKFPSACSKNQEDIGDAMAPFYGVDAGKKLTELLKEHIQIATEVVKAAKENNTDSLDKAQKRWSSNGNDIAAFLAQANPHWDKVQLERMLATHLELLNNEVAARLRKDWTADLEAFDKAHEHMLMFSDMLATGIAKQFPDKIQK